MAARLVLPPATWCSWRVARRIILNQHTCVRDGIHPVSLTAIFGMSAA
jgi:hypothetical protein